MKLLEPHESALSNHCVICTNGLNRESAPIVVDTLVDFDLPGHHLDGRKLICQGCVNDIAGVVGLFSASQLAEIKTYLGKYRTAIEEQRISIDNAYETLGESLTVWPAPPHIDHLHAPKQVLDVETAIQSEAAATSDAFVKVDPREAF